MQTFFFIIRTQIYVTIHRRWIYDAEFGLFLMKLQIIKGGKIN